MVAGLRKGRNGGLLFNEFRVQFCRMKRILEMNGGDHCTAI
jgi:hypothetical protein